MKVNPVKQYSKAKYPTKLEVENNSAFLNKVPNRWVGNSIIRFTASALIILSLSACGRSRTSGAPPPPPRISEQEALNIIYEEAMKVGINLGEKNVEIRDLELPKESKDLVNEELMSEKQSIVLDGYDSKKNVGIEYISEYLTESKEENYLSILENIHGGKKAAEILSNDFKNIIKDKKVGVFYDPQCMNKKESIENLRIQVKDFLEWLKVQGII